MSTGDPICSTCGSYLQTMPESYSLYCPRCKFERGNGNRYYYETQFHDFQSVVMVLEQVLKRLTIIEETLREQKPIKF